MRSLQGFSTFPVAHSVAGQRRKYETPLPKFRAYQMSHGLYSGFFLHPKLHVTIDFAQVFLIAKMDSVLHDQRLRQWVRQTLSDSQTIS
jgi:hypothetical protein